MSQQRVESVKQMVAKLHELIQMEPAIAMRVEAVTAFPTPQNITQLGEEVEQVQEVLNGVVGRVDQFEEEVVFADDPHQPMLDHIRSDSIGRIEHAIAEKIDLVHRTLPSGLRWSSYNRWLSRRVQTVNNTIDNCIKHLHSQI